MLHKLRLHSIRLAETISMTDAEITFSNKAYGELWYENLYIQNPTHFQILEAIIEEIIETAGGDISKASIFKRRPDIEQRISELRFDIIPGRGQMLQHNGNGIRHAKFTPSKSIAVVWENIRGVVCITFDDHSPVSYHRAITHLRKITLGQLALPLPARNSGHFMRKMRASKKKGYRKSLKGFDPKRRFYE